MDRSGIVRNLPWTEEAQVFKEFIPRRDSIEYTLFWREPDGEGGTEKKRMDFEITTKELEDADHAENWVVNKAYELYKAGKFVSASAPPEMETLTADKPEEPVEEQDDPFTPENAPGLALIVQMRIYDVLLAMYTEMNPERAAKMIEMHQMGKVLGPLPNFDPDQT